MPTKHANPKVVFLAAPLMLAAQAGDVLPASFSGEAYTGGVVPSYGAVIDLASTKVLPKMALLSEHDRGTVVGLIDKASNDGNKILVGGALYSDMAGSKAENIAQLSQRGFPYQMSVGLYNFSEEWVPAGVTANVNGKEIPGPVTVLRNGTVRECSICVLGADSDTSATFFHEPDEGATHTGNTDMNLEQLTAAVATLTAENAALKAAAADRDKKDADTAAANLAAAKTKRAADIVALFAEAGEKPSDAQLAAFGGMDESSFALFAADRRATFGRVKKLDPKLFAELATGDVVQDQPKGKVIDMAAIYSKRAQAVLKA